MLVLLFATVNLIQTCEYHCQTCNFLQEFCSSCPATRTSNINEKESTYVCANKIWQILEDMSACNADSKCTSCGNEELTHRVLTKNQVCICKEGYPEVWFACNCQSIIGYSIQTCNSINKFFNFTIFYHQLNIQIDQNKDACSQMTIGDQQIMAAIHINQFQNRVKQNDQYYNTLSYGQSYLEKFDNLFVQGIKLNPGSSMAWAANVQYLFYQYYSGMRIVNQNQWKFVIYQIPNTKNMKGMDFCRLHYQNENVNSENQNHLIDTTEGKYGIMLLFSLRV